MCTPTSPAIAKAGVLSLSAGRLVTADHIGGALAANVRA
ncbi:hydrolase MUTT1 [Mycobacterium tuberculosis]|nr:hydrolase MUTT1 [Mycobacterium tuberculosis]